MLAAKPLTPNAIPAFRSNAALRKLLQDRDYWDALDRVSGPYFEVFAVRDTEGCEYEIDRNLEMMTATSLSRSRSRAYFFSALLKQYFGEEKTRLAYPSFVLFLAENGQIKYCRLIPLQRGTIEETFERLSRLFGVIATGIEEVGGPTVSSDSLWGSLKIKLLEANYTLYIQNPPRDVADAVRQLTAFVEK
jgi:hypothetical protein